MKFKLSRHAIVAIIGVIVLINAGCTTVVRGPARVVHREMPPPPREIITAPPSANYNWVQGHWAWDNRWVWRPGQYVTVPAPPMPIVVQERITIAPSYAHAYVRGHWRWGGNAWVWTRGRWVL